MLFETIAASKFAVAKVAFPRFAIPRPPVDCVRDVRITFSANEVLGDEIVRVLGTHEAVYLVAVQMGRLRACSTLKVVSHSGGGSTSRGTEWTLDLGAAVDA